MIIMTAHNFLAATETHLNSKQQEINNEVSYSDKVTKADSLWKSKSKKHFDDVRVVLDKMCVGSRRCNYCEDSVADEVEHIKPKSIYPSDCFKSENYLYSCGPCNGPKNNKYAIFDQHNNVIDVSRKKGGAVIPPQNGHGVFINPRIENPLDFIILELNTFFFVPYPGKSPLETARATYTIETLELNTRDYLVNAREHAFHSYKDSLENYVNKKLIGLKNDLLLIRKNEINGRHHPTVWSEMKRQRDFHSDLKQLFDAAPELL
ncbi:HNH endonuclease family protein [Pantoea agglomerans]|uniref:hypothetical protein n=1 Tax=Enterobacter agglomerans TaxID=549 RepID=UPI001654A6C1|nr:hypothetical protein [Pantoea agglomerans]